jgi:uncharacterized protein
MNLTKTLLACIVLSMLLVSCGSPGDQTSARRGFEKRIRDTVDAIWIIDTHEHLMLEESAMEQGPYDFYWIFKHYLEEDLQSAGMNSRVKNLITNKNLALSEKWQIVKPFWERTMNTGYAMVPKVAARDLYGINEINDDTYEELSRRINENMKPGWYRHVLKEKGKIELSILDGGMRVLDKEFYRQVVRFDQFVLVDSYEAIKSISDQGVRSLDEFVFYLEESFAAGLAHEMVAVKSGLAYNRIIKYDDITKEEAEMVFNSLKNKAISETISKEEIKKLQDYMFHQICRLTQKNELPMMIHTGLHAGNGNWITNSNPTHLANLFFKFPHIKFILMHGAYPYGGELATLAKNFPNVYIDMTWTQAISISYSKRYLHEWIETVPANKIMGFGGDYIIVEGAYGHSVIARQVIAEVLSEKVAEGYFTEEEATRLARRILRENAIEIFGLFGRNTNVDLPALAQEGLTADLWEMVKTNSGFITSWQTSGPFDLVASEITENYAPPGFDIPYGPEKEINLKSSYEGLFGPVVWKSVETGKNGMLEFLKLYPQEPFAIVYAYAEIISPDNRTVSLTLGSDDGAKMWINGEEVYNEHIQRAAVPDEVMIEVELQVGINPILLKVENIAGDWGAVVRMVDPLHELNFTKFN